MRFKNTVNYKVLLQEFLQQHLPGTKIGERLYFRVSALYNFMYQNLSMNQILEYRRYEEARNSTKKRLSDTPRHPLTHAEIVRLGINRYVSHMLSSNKKIEKVYWGNSRATTHFRILATGEQPQYARKKRIAYANSIRMAFREHGTLVGGEYKLSHERLLQIMLDQGMKYSDFDATLQRLIRRLDEIHAKEKEYYWINQNGFASARERRLQQRKKGNHMNYK